MKVLLVHAHPEPRSFVGAMKTTAIEVLKDAGHDVTVSDLYQDGFRAAAGPWDFTKLAEPEIFNLGNEQANAAERKTFAPEVQREMDRLFAADLLILEFPMWWFSVPGILKGWIDRVFAYGVTYDFGRTWDNGVMAGRKAMLAFTTGAPPGAFEPDGRSGDLERVLWPIHAGVLALCGYEVLPPFIGWAVPWIGADGRAAVLNAWIERLKNVENDAPMFFHKLSDFGDDHRLKPDIEPRTPAQHRGKRLNW